MSQASPRGKAKPRPVNSCAVAGGAGDAARPLTSALRRVETLPRYRPMRRRRARMPPSSIRGSATAAPRQARRRVRGHIRPAIARPAGGGVGTVRLPHGLGSALPPADRDAATQNAAGDGSQPERTANGEAGAAAATPYGAGGTTGYLRLPVRRRRRLPRPPGLQRGTAEVAPPNGDTPAGDTADQRAACGRRVPAPPAAATPTSAYRRSCAGRPRPISRRRTAGYPSTAARPGTQPPPRRGRVTRRSTRAIWGAATSRARPWTA